MNCSWTIHPFGHLFFLKRMARMNRSLVLLKINGKNELFLLFLTKRAKEQIVLLKKNNPLISSLFRQKRLIHSLKNSIFLSFFLKKGFILDYYTLQKERIFAKKGFVHFFAKMNDFVGIKNERIYLPSSRSKTLWCWRQRTFLLRRECHSWPRSWLKTQSPRPACSLFTMSCCTCFTVKLKLSKESPVCKMHPFKGQSDKIITFWILYQLNPLCSSITIFF